MFCRKRNSNLLGFVKINIIMFGKYGNAFWSFNITIFPSILLDIMHKYSIILGKNLSSFFGRRQERMRDKRKKGAGILRGAFLVPADAVPPFFIRRYSERRYTYHRCLFGATASAGTHTAVFYSALQRAPVQKAPSFFLFLSKPGIITAK